MIKFSCPKCGKSYHIDEAQAGKKGKCSNCGLELRVPSPSTVSEEPTPLASSVPEDTPTPIVAQQRPTPTPRSHRSKKPIAIAGIVIAGLAIIAVIITILSSGGDEMNIGNPEIDKVLDEMNTGNPEIDKALDKMEFENAPTLGPVARKNIVAMVKGEWEKIWDTMPSDTHKQYEQYWESDKNKGSDEEKEMANKAGSAKEYYILRREKTEKSEEEWVKYITKEEDKIKVAGEEFEAGGKTGWIKVKTLKTGKERKMGKLVKEGNEWKIEY